MSDTANTPDFPAATPDDLDQRVQTLVAQIDEATARIERAAADDPAEAPTGEALQDIAPPEEAAARQDPAPRPPPVPDTAPEAAPAAHLDADAPRPAEATASQAADPEDPEIAELEPPEPAAVTTPDDSTADDPTAGEPADSDAAASPSPPPAPESLEDLDAGLEADLDRLLAAEAAETARAEEQPHAETPVDPELESQLDELLKHGEISAPQPVEQEANTRSRLDRQLAKLRDEDLEGGPEPARPALEEEHSPPPAPPPAPQPVAPAPHPARPKRSLLTAAIIELLDLARRAGPRVAARVEPAAYLAAAAMTRPLEKRGRAKQIVGWLALYTAFLAACVWVYILLVRPAAPQPTGEGPRIAGVE